MFYQFPHPTPSTEGPLLLSTLNSFQGVSKISSTCFNPVEVDGKCQFVVDTLANLSLTPFKMGFPGGSAGKESACDAGDLDSIPGLGRSSGEGNGYPLQYSGLQNSMAYIVHGVTKS